MAYLTSLGWMMALPIAGGILLGRWADQHFGTGSGWTLGLLCLGLVIACLEVFLGMRAALRRQPKHER